MVRILIFCVIGIEINDVRIAYSALYNMTIHNKIDPSQTNTTNRGIMHCLTFFIFVFLRQIKINYY